MIGWKQDLEEVSACLQRSLCRQMLLQQVLLAEIEILLMAMAPFSPFERECGS